MTVRALMTDLKTPVSNRQFAKMVGRAESAVRKAKDRQSILEGVTSDGKLIPEIAAREWGVEILSEFGGTEKPSVKKIVKPPTVKLIKSKPGPVTADDFVKEMLNEPVPKVSREDIDNFDPDEEEGEISEGITKVEAERRKAILQAKILEIAYQEKRGELLPREKLEKVLFGYGQEIRTMLTAVSTQVIDKVRACDERHEALKILDDAIHDALNILTDIEGRKL